MAGGDLLSLTFEIGTQHRLVASGHVGERKQQAQQHAAQQQCGVAEQFGEAGRG
jgi:hypothetical protein